MRSSRTFRDHGATSAVGNIGDWYSSSQDSHKDQIITRGLALGVDFGLTHSCYDPAPDGRSCGRCDSCVLRLAAFNRLGLTDPVAYVGPIEA